MDGSGCQQTEPSIPATQLHHSSPLIFVSSKLPVLLNTLRHVPPCAPQHHLLVIKTLLLNTSPDLPNGLKLQCRIRPLIIRMFALQRSAEVLLLLPASSRQIFSAQRLAFDLSPTHQISHNESDRVDLNQFRRTVRHTSDEFLFSLTLPLRSQWKHTVPRVPSDNNGMGHQLGLACATLEPDVAVYTPRSSPLVCACVRSVAGKDTVVESRTA